MGSGLIYGAIVVVWAAVLVPMWLRRHDEIHELRSVDRFSRAMRILSRREPAGDQRYVVMPRRPAGASGVVRSDGPRIEPEVWRKPPRPRAAEPRRPEVTIELPEVLPGAPRLESPVAAGPSSPIDAPVRVDAPAAGSERRPAAAARRVSTAGAARRPSRTLVARRRRVVTVLAAVTLLLAVLAPMTTIASWDALVPLTLLVAYVVHLRMQARRREEIRRSRARSAQAGEARLRRLDSAGRVVSTRADRMARETAAARDAAAAHARRADAAAAELEASRQAALVESADDEVEGGWRPVPVPLPTYVTKPKASRTIRTIDLSTEGLWAEVEAQLPRQGETEPLVADGAPSSAPDVASHVSADVELEEDDELDAILERRAVND